MNFKQSLLSGSFEISNQHARTELRLKIENLLIELNQELFQISEELAQMFCISQNKSDGKNRKNSLSTDLLSKAKNFKKRCNILIKQVASTIQINPIARSISRQ